MAELKSRIFGQEEGGGGERIMRKNEETYEGGRELVGEEKAEEEG